MVNEPSSILDKLLNISDLSKNQAEIFDYFSQGGTLQQALQLSQEEMNAQYDYAFDLFERQQYSDSLIIFSHLTTLNPRIKKYWFAAGAAQVRLKNMDDALKTYAIISVFDPQDPEPYYLSAFCYLESGHKDEAKKSLRLAIAHATDSTPWRENAQALYAQLESQEARRKP